MLQHKEMCAEKTPGVFFTTHIHVRTHILTQKERERKKERKKERERETDRDRETEKERIYTFYFFSHIFEKPILFFNCHVVRAWSLKQSDQVH